MNLLTYRHTDRQIQRSVKKREQNVKNENRQQADNAGILQRSKNALTTYTYWEKLCWFWYWNFQQFVNTTWNWDLWPQNSGNKKITKKKHHHCKNSPMNHQHVRLCHEWKCIVLYTQIIVTNFTTMNWQLTNVFVSACLMFNCHLLSNVASIVYYIQQWFRPVPAPSASSLRWDTHASAPHTLSDCSASRFCSQHFL